ncbi:MAG TPA: hypothetical protein VK324_04585, partial [Tepidisphaeraceae bacterium]|nr:hypothetical protein [Tepidisphaeraceae bacterium]
CLLAPRHGAQVRAVLDLIGPEQAVLVIQPDWRALRVALHTTDLSSDLTARRLWFAAGSDWAAALEALLGDHPGLPVPARFVRLADLEDTADPLIATAQPVFSREIHRRAELITARRAAWVPRGAAASFPRLCVIAPAAFRLWRDAPHALTEALARTTPQHVAVRYDAVDTDCPATSSPLAVQAAALASDAVVAADVARSDHPNLLPAGLPWLTWVTTSRMPAFDPAAAHDRLLLADAAWRSKAAEAGWPADRVCIAAWPVAPTTAAPPAADLVLIADVTDLSVPESVEEFSSHRLLWEAIRDELTANPFALTTDVASYLAARMRKQNLTADDPHLDRKRFVDDLILPAYAQGLARTLIGAGAAPALYGHGWAALPAFAAHARGPLRTRADFSAATRAAAALVRPWPFDYCPHLSATGRPVIRAAGSKTGFLTHARDALAGSLSPDAPQSPALSAEIVLGLLAGPEKRG